MGLSGLTGEQFLDAHEEPEGTFPFALSHGPSEQLARARAELEEALEWARTFSDDRTAAKAVTDAKTAVEKAERAAEEATYLIRFKALPRPEWDALKDKKEHAPTEKQIREADKANDPRPVWNEDAFAPAAIAACVTDPVFTIDTAKRFWHEFSAGECDALFLSIVMLNQSRTAPRVGKGSGPTED